MQNLHEQPTLNARKNNSSGNSLEGEIKNIKERNLSKISPMILIKPAIFSFIVLLVSFFVDISTVPILGNVTSAISKELFPTWQPAENAIQPIQFWWLPLISYLFFIGIAYREYRSLFTHVRAATSKENMDRIISSSISLIDGYATALPLVGAAILLVSIKLGPEVFLGISVPFEIKALIVLAIAKLFEPVLDYIGVKFQKIINITDDYKEQYYQKLQASQNEKLLQALTNYNNSPVNFQSNELTEFREELERIKTISFETYQNFSALNKLTSQINTNLHTNEKHLFQLNELSKNIHNMATNLNNDGVASSLNSLNSIVNRR